MVDKTKNPKSKIQNPKSRILIVEDDAIISAHLQDALTGWGYVPLAVASGEAAIRRVAEARPKLVLMDIRLAGEMDGVEAAEQIQARFDVPVIYLTAYADDALLQRARATEPYSFLVKPIKERELRAAIEMALYKHKMDRKLKESEKRFRSVVETASDAIISVNSRGNVVFWNNSAETIFGYAADEIINRPLTMIVPERFREEHQNGIKRMALGGEPHIIGKTVEVTGLKKDGSEFPLEFSLATWQSGEETFFTGIIRDITRRTQAEKMLQESELKYRSLFETMVEGFAHHQIVLDDQDKPIDYIFLNINRSFEKLTGLQSLDILGKRVTEALPGIENDPADWIGTYGKVALGGEPISSEQYSEPLNRWYSVFAYSPAPLQFVTLFHDITERKQAEEMLAQRAAQLSFINDIGGKIAAVMELDSVLDRATRLIQEMFSYHHIALFLIEGELLRLRAIAGAYQSYFPSDHTQRLDEGINGWVAGRGERIVTNNVELEPRYISLIAEHASTRSKLCLPIKVAGQTIGVLDIQSGQLDAFNQNDVIAMETLTDQLAVAIENARLYEAIQYELAERERVEKQLRASEERFRQVITSISDHIYVTEITEDGSYSNLYLSPNIEDLTGYPLEKFLDDWSFWASTVIHPDDRAIAAKQSERLARGEASEVEYRLAQAGGEVIWVRDSGRVKTDKGVKTIYGVISDITGQVQAREKIRRRNRELTLLNQVITASTVDLEPEAVLETACRELARAFNLPQAAAALLNEQKTAAVVVAEYLAEGRPAALHHTIPVEGNPSFQYLFTHKAPLAVDDAQNDPRLVSIHDLMRRRGTVSMLLLPLIIEGEVIGSLGLDAVEPRPFSTEEINLAWIAADQVAGALARVRLAQTRQLLNTAIEQAAESVIITDTEGVILYVNPAFERVTGYSRTEVIGQNPRILKSGKQDVAFYQNLWATISAGQVWNGRFINKKKDGSLYTEEATITPVHNENGAITNYVALRRDVTRELELDEQYRQAKKMEAIGRLAGGVAHDFNNLLTVILGHSEFLLSDYYDPHDPRREEVEQIKTAGERASVLTRQLLAFSRRQPLQPQALNLNEIITNLKKMLRRLIGEDIILTANLDPNSDWVKADPGQMEQVLMNLAINARDAMPRGGKLTIETANVNLDEAYAEQHLEVVPGPHVRLMVTDTGIGMDAETRARIFEPFFTTKASGKGTGLGLSTVYGIVQQSGGHIRVHSEPGRGVTFKIYLPRSGEVTKTAVPHRDPAVSLEGTETILLVEDEAGVRLVTRKFLQKRGYTVLQAGHAEDALQVVQQYGEQIDLLVTDIIMHDMSGYELSKRLVQLHPKLKVLYITGYADDVLNEHGVPASSIMLLEKPFSIEVLARAVRQVLNAG